ncbi:glutaredoxin domain-containing protein [Pseudomonas sp. CC6-YY-74]|uniref:glutaredoxin family protein n=1 Tax=Pseudomonas sp. CC6-YY-74 TaxID=1930532 RepID=UPI001C4395A8|nr:glutaredoxin domain-containing protein [Pseudomonas sp. CC6-YY-74]
MLPDTGERYLSTPLFDDIAVDMSEEEQQLASSTPNYRFDVSPATPSAAQPEPIGEEVDAKIEALLAQILADRQQPLVMFALEWCEFCWSARKLFNALGVAYRSVDLDSVEYQQDDLGGRLRVALRRKSGMLSIPQIFVGGELVGGCNELFGAYADGRLATLLRAQGVELAEVPAIDPTTLAPAWLHPRS